MGIKFSQAGTYLCSEGPRRETRAEVRKYAQWGADLVGHSLAPEAFLARELQLCYASICFISDFAETGSEHRPFTAGGLFKDINVQPSEKQTRESLSLMPGIISKLLDSFDGAPSECSCHKNMAGLIASGSLSKDFHEWFESLRPISTKSSIEKTSKIPLPAVSPSVLKTPSANRV
jgi:5'-methylthioadenosine phosphorylase